MTAGSVDRQSRWAKRRVPSRRCFLLSFMAVALAGCGKDRQQIELSIESDGDFLAFKPDQLSCPTGAEVRLIFHHAGKFITQEHNWVLVAPGAEEAVEQAAIAAGEANGFVPPRDRRVLAATALCGKGQRVMVEFIAPAPGDYPFICTNPGHGDEMRGVLHVTGA